MTEPAHDHDPSSDPPGAVSDQNSEEAQSGHREDGTHPEPRTSGEKAKEHESDDEKGESDDKKGESGDASSGAAGEGSQSTGHRHNAG